MIQYSDNILQMKLILGSASKWRRQILQQAGYEFSTMSPDIDSVKGLPLKLLNELMVKVQNNALE